MSFNYIDHPMGNYANLGLNLIGSRSTIKASDDTFWEFQYFGINGTENCNNAYYKKYNNDGTLSEEGKWFTIKELKETCKRIVFCRKINPNKN